MAVEKKKMKGLSAEMAAAQKSNKSSELVRTEAFINLVNKNMMG